MTDMDLDIIFLVRARVEEGRDGGSIAKHIYHAKHVKISKCSCPIMFCVSMHFCNEAKISMRL